MDRGRGAGFRGGGERVEMEGVPLSRGAQRRWVEMAAYLDQKVKGSVVRTTVDTVCRQLRGANLVFDPSKVIPTPGLVDHQGWSKVVKKLVASAWQKVVFCDTEATRPNGPCAHAELKGTDIQLPCYGEEARRSDPVTKRLCELLDNYVDWDWANFSWHKTTVRDSTCPDFVRVLTLANAEGWSVCVDFFTLGGVPEEIGGLLQDPEVAKVFYNLKSDWNRLRATCPGLEVGHLASFYDLELFDAPSRKRNWFKRVVPSWRMATEPSFSTVVAWWLASGKATPPRWQGDAETFGNSLSEVARLASGTALDKATRGHGGLVWLYHKQRPLTDEEIKYALTDATVLPLVLVLGVLAVPAWRKEELTPKNAVDMVLGRVGEASSLRPMVRPLARKDIEAKLQRQLAGSGLEVVARFNAVKLELRKALRKLEKRQGAVDKPAVRLGVISVWEFHRRRETQEVRALCRLFAAARRMDQWTPTGWEHQSGRRMGRYRAWRQRLAQEKLLGKEPRIQLLD